jgi:hypothetical protein
MKGTIQVDSPPPFMTRPVGGKPGHAALMYVVQHWFHKKVARTIKNISDIQDLPYFAGAKGPRLPSISSLLPSKCSSAFFAQPFAFSLETAYNGRFYATPR